MGGEDKLDARSKYLLGQRGEEEAASPLSVFLRGREPFTDEQLEGLRDSGAEIRTVAGDVLTATVPADALDGLLARPFVVSAEISQPLYTDSGEAPPADVE